MKKKNCVSDYILSRNLNLRREFISRLGRDSLGVEQVIAGLARNARADRFYVSEDRAYLMLKNGHVSASARRGMFRDIKNGVDELLKAYPSMSLKDAVYTVVNSPAPSFYLSASTIRTIIYKQKIYKGSYGIDNNFKKAV